MTIFSVFVISKSGGLIYSHDNHAFNPEVEKTFSYPLDLRLDYVNQRIVVTFGQRDGIRGLLSSFTVDAYDSDESLFVQLATLSFL